MGARARVLAPVLLLVFGGAAPAPAWADGTEGEGSMNAFALGLYRAVSAPGPGTNVFLSPWSVSTALALAARGASGATRDAMERTLGLADAQGVAAMSAMAALPPGEAGGVTLEAANSLWLRAGMEFRPDFLAAGRDAFHAEVATLDFADPSAPARVNAWVARATHDRIPTIVDGFDGDTALLIANAVYFKGRWAVPFERAETSSAPFHSPAASGAGGAAAGVPVPFMHRGGRMAYLDAGEVQVLSLPYEGSRFELVIVLPRAADGLPEVVRGLTPERWNAWMSGLEGHRGRIAIPRFRMEREAGLRAALASLGMAVAFDPASADFSRMSDSPGRIFVRDVRHKTFVEVNEEGTEAAGATGVVMGITSVDPTPPFEFIADHPFLFAIRDSASGMLCFMGSLFDPR